MNYGDYGLTILNLKNMRLTSKIFLLVAGLCLSPLAWAQQLTGKSMVANAAPTEPTYLIGTGITAPGALLYRGPIAGQFLAPMVPASRPVTSTAPSVAMTGAENPAPTPGASSLSCIQLAARVEAEISKSPKDVLSVARRAMVDNDACACEIVKSSIKATGADDELTGLIVEVAVKTQPSRFKEIVECAILAKPSAKTQVRAALERVFGTKGSGKGGKIVIAQVPMPRVVVREMPQIFFPPFTTYSVPIKEEPPGDKPPGDSPPRNPPPPGGDDHAATPTNPCPHPHRKPLRDR